MAGAGGPKIPTPHQGRNVERLFWLLWGPLLWLRSRLGTHFCFYLLSLGFFSALFFLLGPLLVKFCAIWKSSDHRKTKISFEMVVKITLFVVFASGAGLGLS